MNTAQVIQWLRQQSKRFAEMADEIESVLGTQGNVGPLTHQVSPNGTVAILDVVEAMRDRSMRLSTLARQMNVTQQALTNVMTEANGFTCGDRGWYSYEGVEATE